MYRPFVIGFFLLSTALLVLLIVVQSQRLHGFLQEVPALRSAEQMRRYKRLVAHDMYLGVLAKLLLGLGGLAFPIVVIPCIGLVVNQFLGIHLFDLLLIVGLNLLVYAAAATPRGIWEQMMSIPVEDEGLRPERDHVVKVWQTRPFPDW